MKGTDNALLREDHANEGNIHIFPEIRVYFPGSALKSHAAYSVENGFGSLVSGSWSPYGKHLVFVTTEGEFFSLKRPRLAKPSDKWLS